MHGPAAYENYDQAAAADRLLFREGSRLTVGGNAFHQLDPSEIAMRIEEFGDLEHAASEREQLRQEMFCGLVEYIFADGPAPADIRSRLEGFFASFHPDLAAKIHGPVSWCAAETVAHVLHKHLKKLAEVRACARGRGSLFVWSRELEAELDWEFAKQTLIRFVELLASEGKTWRNLVAVAYGLAKAFRPMLIAGMSLHDIAILSGDEGGRATPCDRIKRLVNRRIASAGAKGCNVHFQKSPETVKKYSAAQMGNTNRTRKNPSKKTKHDPRK